MGLGPPNLCCSRLLIKLLGCWVEKVQEDVGSSWEATHRVTSLGWGAALVGTEC